MSTSTSTANPLPEPTIDTPKDVRVRVRILTGYVLHQNRPWECQSWGQHPDGHYTYGCKCGQCDGTYVEVDGTYDGTIFWMDNSIEGVVCLDAPVNGKVYHTVQYKAPSGDACF